MIYILEDDDNIRKLIKYSLTSQNFETQDFALPSEFWNSLQKAKLDENQHTVFTGTRQLFLTVKEFDLLLLLMKNHGNVLTREYLLETVWELSTDIESRTVDVHIRTLRHKLGDAGNSIETIIKNPTYKYFWFCRNSKSWWCR